MEYLIRVERNKERLLKMRKYAVETALDCLEYRLNPEAKPGSCYLSNDQLEALQARYEGCIKDITDRLCEIVRGDDNG